MFSAYLNCWFYKKEAIRIWSNMKRKWLKRRATSLDFRYHLVTSRKSWNLKFLSYWGGVKQVTLTSWTNFVLYLTTSNKKNTFTLILSACQKCLPHLKHAWPNWATPIQNEWKFKLVAVLHGKTSIRSEETDGQRIMLTD